VRPLDLGEETICLNSDGLPWVESRDGTFNGFGASFQKARKVAQITGVTFHDLRGTAVTRLVIAGCSLPQVCEITGHTHAEANAILKAHYLARDPQIAMAAIRKVEDVYGDACEKAAREAKGQ
jgi:hypothetical protein